MDINKCNIYFGNLKIKTIYFGQYKVYEDTPIQYLTFLQFGMAVVTNTVIPPVILDTTETKIEFLQFGTAVITNTIT